MTIRLYAERKGWAVDTVEVVVAMETVENQPRIGAHLTLGGDLTEEQRDRLREIGDRCPVRRLLSRATDIQTMLAPGAP